MALLACQRNAYQRQEVQEVLSCTPTDDGFAVLLRDSLLYPEGGGQPADHGTLAGQPVHDVQKHAPGVVRCLLSAPVEAGPQPVEIDWSRRFDLMQQHSAQHLVTAIAHDRLNVPTVGFHLGETYAAIELETPKISDTQLAQLSTWTQDAIRAAHPIRWRAVSPEEFTTLDVRTRGLPDDHEGELRLVEIEGLDLNTCGGTHVASTAELQVVTFLGLEKMRGRLRLSYLAGERVLSRFQAQQERERALGSLFSCGPEELLPLCQKSLDEAQAQKRTQKDLRSELAGLLGAQLAQQDGPLWSLHRTDADLGFLGSIAQAFQAHHPEGLLFLTAGAEQGPGVFLLAGPKDLVKQAGARVTDTMEGRGGGKPGRYQGKVTRLDKLPQAQQELHNLLS